jgi:uracil-DNA glycosylase family 4
MSVGFHQLLDAAISHLEDLKAHGVRYVAASPELIDALRQPVAARPKPAITPPAAGPRPIRAPAPGPVQPVPEQREELVESPPAPASERLLQSPALSPAAKAQAMAELRERARVCVKCPHLVAVRKNVVFGVGDPNAQLMFVGEAPGVDEDVQGEPFVGRAGQLLTRIIQTMGLSRETVYIANILKCRPDTPGQAFGNRKPTPDEMATCIPYLRAQVDLIRPRALVALGATAIEGLLGKTLGITRLRGQWQTYEGIPLMPTFHPSFLLRPENASKKRLVWEDMLQVMDKLGMPISEKQRGYFLKP